MSKVKIDKNDSCRILLTELLPYEVPMLFSNEGFYEIVRSNQYDEFFNNIRDKKKDYGIPFNYLISKSNEGETRTLSIIHPFNQYKFIEFYKLYDSIIIHLCSKSPFSLRKINNVARFCYSADMVFEEDTHSGPGTELEPDALDIESKVYKSYFVYKSIDLIYKFYDRNEYQRLEQRFNLLWEFDISKCFYHIYTHSITWAIKDKETAKRNAGLKTFENKFDKLMQLSNYNETNGIVVGPEISRIFAEILLQQVDVNVLNKLNDKGLKFGVDYEIRRYVDDFFVFSNDEKALEIILTIYKKELEFYKLYLNTNKTKKTRAPFITHITVAKRQVRKLVSQLFEDITIKQEEVRSLIKINKPYYKSQYFIKEFQCIVRVNDITYDIVNKDVVRLFKSELVTIFRSYDLALDKEIIEGFLLMYLDIVFYCYSLNINASSTFKIAQIIVLVNKFVQDKDEDLKHSIFSKISREAEFVMTIYHRKLADKETNIEILNLLIPLKMMGDGYYIPEKKLREYFDLTIDKEINQTDKHVHFKKLNYFQIITLLYYFDQTPQYLRLKLLVEKAVVKKFEEEEFPFHKSELTCLFFDFICCPFVDINSKKKVIRHSNYVQDNANIIENAITRIMDQKMWFMNWDSNIDLEKVLKKKEWTSSY